MRQEHLAVDEIGQIVIMHKPIKPVNKIKKPKLVKPVVQDRITFRDMIKPYYTGRNGYYSFIYRIDLAVPCTIKHIPAIRYYTYVGSRRIDNAGEYGTYNSSSDAVPLLQSITGTKCTYSILEIVQSGERYKAESAHIISDWINPKSRDMSLNFCLAGRHTSRAKYCTFHHIADKRWSWSQVGTIIPICQE